MEVMRALRARRDLRYTYRFLIVPETIGSVAFLAASRLIPTMRGGVFLEMLGLDQPHALQLSFDGDTPIDRAGRRALKAVRPGGWTAPFRTLAGNDERQFNAPGVRVPMLSLSRMLPPNPDCLLPRVPHQPRHGGPGQRPQPRRVLHVGDGADRHPRDGSHRRESLQSATVFCSRFGFQIDWSGDRLGTERLFEALDMIDGSETISSIARRAGLPFAATRQLNPRARTSRTGLAARAVAERPCRHSVLKSGARPRPRVTRVPGFARPGSPARRVAYRDARLPQRRRSGHAAGRGVAIDRDLAGGGNCRRYWKREPGLARHCPSTSPIAVDAFAAWTSDRYLTGRLDAMLPRPMGRLLVGASRSLRRASPLTAARLATSRSRLGGRDPVLLRSFVDTLCSADLPWPAVRAPWGRRP